MKLKSFQKFTLVCLLNVYVRETETQFFCIKKVQEKNDCNLRCEKAILVVEESCLQDEMRGEMSHHPSS